MMDTSQGHMIGGLGCTTFPEICPENKRDRKSLEALIQVRVGTKILTDG